MSATVVAHPAAGASGIEIVTGIAGAVQAYTTAAAPRPGPPQRDLAKTPPAPAKWRRSPNAEPSSMEALVGGAVAGDRRAVADLLAQIQPLVLRYCRARFGRQETVLGSADDIAQDICVAVISALPSYQLKGLSFRAFVYGIAAHKVADAFRAIGRNRTDPVAELPDAALHTGSPEQRLIQTELVARLGVLLHHLTARQREILVLRIAVGLSAEETAQIVGSTSGAVRVTQHRALARLRGMLDGTDSAAAGPAEQHGA